MLYQVSSYRLLPQEPGVYQFLDKSSNVLYVGKAKNLKNRVASYFVNSDELGDKTRLMISQAHKIKITIVESEIESLLLEANLIKKYAPKYNSNLKDGKMYPSIRITVRETHPAVLFARKQDDPDSLYFGPFPNATAMKLVLRTIRRIFPYQSVAHHQKRICLYHHLGLCPCPSAYEAPEVKKEYKKTIRRIITFLHGKSNAVIKDLEKERDKESKAEQFEKALDLQKKIDAMYLITHPVHKPLEYTQNPNLRTDLRDQEMERLKLTLNNKGMQVKTLERIECYDISNMQGRHAVASMVVLTNGERDSSEYRRFRMIKNGKPNDTAMMQEVLTRRLKHDEWPEPGLIVVDGGKGQVSSAVAVLKEKKREIPLIGLAKREETIILPDFTEVSLPKDSPALHLIQRIRDEAHRFAITYHRKLRSQAFVTKYP